MSRFSSMFSQLLKLFPRTEFQALVKRTFAERHARGFTCWGQCDITQQLTPEGTTSFLRSLAIDEMLSVANSNGSFFSIADPLGSTLAIIDATGNSVAEYTYDPFGATTTTNPAFVNPFQFTGRENDALNGLYYYRARYYSPPLQVVVG